MGRNHLSGFPAPLKYQQPGFAELMSNYDKRTGHALVKLQAAYLAVLQNGAVS